MIGALRDILIGIIGGVLSVYAIYQFSLGQRFLQRVFGVPFHIAKVIADGGISRMTLSRADYHKYRVGAGDLRSYLGLAKQCIDIVSISLNVTQAEGDLISLFSQKINENPTYRVRITLLDPSCSALQHLAKSLALEPEELEREIRDTLRQLVRCKDKLEPGARDRLEILVHETIPIGSALLLDAVPDTGRIQVETKLYKAPRIESFGFEVVGPSPFYSRNFTAWQKVFSDSRRWEENRS